MKLRPEYTVNCDCYSLDEIFKKRTKHFLQLQQHFVKLKSLAHSFKTRHAGVTVLDSD